jgi:hypothetical protein
MVLRGDTMIENTTKASNSSLPSEDQHLISSPITQESIPINTSKNTVITITLPVVKEQRITIEGIPDLNNDGVIDIKDVLIAIKQQIEKNDSANP